MSKITISANPSSESSIKGDDLGLRAAYLVCKEAAESVAEIFNTKITLETSKSVVRLKNKQIQPADATKLIRSALAHLGFATMNHSTEKVFQIEARRRDLVLVVEGSIREGVAPEGDLTLLLG